jgi:hypothetical protein
MPAASIIGARPRCRLQVAPSPNAEVSMEVLPALPEHFDGILPLLNEFRDPRMTRERWWKLLFEPPWPVEEPHRGYVLRDGGEIVGFIGTHFSSRWVNGTPRRFCATSSWIVRESHRGASLQLLRPILDLRSHTILNLMPSHAAHDIFCRLGLQTLETAQYLLTPCPRAREILRPLECTVTTQLAGIRERLDERGRTILDDMSRACAAQALLRCGPRLSHIVAVRSPWKGRWRLAHVLYASDWELFWRHPGLVCAAFFRALGTPGLRVDARHRVGGLPPMAVEKRLDPPRLFRPATPDITPQLVDGLYTELVGQHW